MKTFIIIFSVLAFRMLTAQERVQLYDIHANPYEDLNLAIKQAADSDKHVLIQVGGNWCSWCIKLHRFIEENHVIDSIIKADYVSLKINYTRENPNLELMAQLDYPHRFGFPVLLILDSVGKRLHTQDTGLLEKDNSYDLEQLKRFLLKWNRGALNPDNYKLK